MDDDDFESWLQDDTALGLDLDSATSGSAAAAATSVSTDNFALDDFSDIFGGDDADGEGDGDARGSSNAEVVDSETDGDGAVARSAVSDTQKMAQLNGERDHANDNFSILSAGSSEEEEAEDMLEGDPKDPKGETKDEDEAHFRGQNDALSTTPIEIENMAATNSTGVPAAAAAVGGDDNLDPPVATEKHEEDAAADTLAVGAAPEPRGNSDAESPTVADSGANDDDDNGDDGDDDDDDDEIVLLAAAPDAGVSRVASSPAAKTHAAAEILNWLDEDSDDDKAALKRATSAAPSTRDGTEGADAEGGNDSSKVASQLRVDAASSSAGWAGTHPHSPSQNMGVVKLLRSELDEGGSELDLSTIGALCSDGVPSLVRKALWTRLLHDFAWYKTADAISAPDAIASIDHHQRDELDTDCEEAAHRITHWLLSKGFEIGGYAPPAAAVASGLGSETLAADDTVALAASPTAVSTGNLSSSLPHEVIGWAASMQQDMVGMLARYCLTTGVTYHMDLSRILEVIMLLHHFELVVSDATPNNSNAPGQVDLNLVFSNFAAFCHLNLPRYYAGRPDLPVAENSMWRLLLRYHDPQLVAHLDTEVPGWVRDTEEVFPNVWLGCAFAGSTSEVPAHLLALWDRQLLTAATQLARRRRHQGLSRTQVEGSDTVDEAAGQRSSAGTAKVGGRVEDVGFGLQLLFFIGVEWVIRHRESVLEQSGEAVRVFLNRLAPPSKLSPQSILELYIAAAARRRATPNSFGQRLEMAIEYHNAGDATKQAPVKMLRQSSCLYMSAAEVLDQVFRQRKRSDESTQAADDQRTYVVVDFRTTEELESQAVLRHSSVRLPCHVFEEDADEAVTGLLRRISSLLHRIGESEFGKSDSNSSGSRGPALLFTKTSAPSAATAFSTSSPVTPARLSTMAGAGREAPHLVVMARGGKKSSGLNLAEKLVSVGCTRVSVLHGGFRSVVKCVQRHHHFRKLLGKGYRAGTELANERHRPASGSDSEQERRRRRHAKMAETNAKIKEKMEDLKVKMEEGAKKVGAKMGEEAKKVGAKMGEEAKKVGAKLSLWGGEALSKLSLFTKKAKEDINEAMEASRKDLGQVFNHDVLSGAGGDASPGTRAKAAAAAIERSRHRSSTAEADPEYQERRKAEALAVHRLNGVAKGDHVNLATLTTGEQEIFHCHKKKQDNGLDPDDFFVVERVLVLTSQRLLVLAPLENEVLLDTDMPSEGEEEDADASSPSGTGGTRLAVKSNHHLTELGKLRISNAEPSVITFMYKRVDKDTRRKKHHKVSYKVDRPKQLVSALQKHLRRLKGKE